MVLASLVGKRSSLGWLKWELRAKAMVRVLKASRDEELPASAGLLKCPLHLLLRRQQKNRPTNTELAQDWTSKRTTFKPYYPSPR